MQPCRRSVVDRRTFLVGGTAAALGAFVGTAACESGSRRAADDRDDRPPTTASSATATTQAEPGLDRIVTGDQPNGFTLPAGQTWEMRGLVTTPLNVVVFGRLRQRSGATLRFREVDEQAFVGSSGSHAHTTVTASDVGLWVMDGGVVDLVGTPKTGWVRAADAISAGAHALPLESAEIANLTRDVNIEGTAAGRAHILVHSHQPQTVKHVGIRYMGPRKLTGESDARGPLQASVLGRYALHFHECEGHSRGTVVEGAVITDTGSKCYVPHTSHGITFRDCVSYDTMEDPYWWDGAPSTTVDGPPTDDLIYDHCLAARATWDRDYDGTHMTGFMLGRGVGSVARGCAAVGITGNVEVRSSGFSWPEGSEGVWGFEDCVAHNSGNGILIWQVTGDPTHEIHRFGAYHNHRYGIYSGAYGQNYHFFDSVLYGNGEGGALFWATALFGTEPPLQADLAQRWERVVFDGGDLSDFAVTVAGRSLGMEHPTIVHDCTFRGYRRAAVECTFRFHDFGPGGNNLQLIDCTWDDPDQGRDFLWGAGTDVHETTYMDVTDARHGSIKLRRGDQSGTLNPAWNARVSPL
jgi:hypothetical protein